jgi:hypothetical protein
MNYEISTLIAQRDIAYNISDKHKADDNQPPFLLLSNKMVNAVRAAKRRHSSGSLNPKLPPKSFAISKV